MYSFGSQKIKTFFITHPLIPPKGGDLWNLFSDFHRLNKFKRFNLYATSIPKISDFYFHP